jgi:hypothetical protein
MGLKTLIFWSWQAKIRPLTGHLPLKALFSGFMFLSDFSGFNPAQKRKAGRLSSGFSTKRGGNKDT